VLDGYAEVRSAFRSVPAEPAPERGLESLLAYGEQAAARARSRRRGLQILGLLSAAVALAVIWVVQPVSHREADGLARAPQPKSLDPLARLDTPQAPPEQGNGVRDEAVRERKVPPASPAATQLAEKELPKLEEQAAPGRRAADAKAKEVAKRDAEDKGAAGAPAELRAEASKDRAAGASGMLGVAGAGPSTAVGGAVASSGAAGLKKAGAGQSGADAFHQAASSAAAPAASPPPLVARASADDVQAQDAARAVAAPVGEALASAERGKAAPGDLTQPQPSRPLAKSAAPPAMKAAANVAAPVSRSLPVPAARAGLGSPDQQARLAEIVQKLETATGDERKALMMERCELEAKMERRPDAVLSCSKVTQEFPGTPEAARASQIARGFSVQPPPQAPER
jgi:hypothetical protein